MHSSDLVATANFTGHSMGTAQHLPCLPTCVCVSERECEKQIVNIVQKCRVRAPNCNVSCSPFLFKIFEIAALRQCCEVNYGLRAYKNADYPNYANLKIYIKIFVSYKRKRSEPTSLITSTSTSTSTASASVSLWTDRGKGIGSWCPKLLCSIRDGRTG